MTISWNKKVKGTSVHHVPLLRAEACSGAGLAQASFAGDKVQEETPPKSGPCDPRLAAAQAVKTGGRTVSMRMPSIWAAHSCRWARSAGERRPRRAASLPCFS